MRWGVAAALALGGACAAPRSSAPLSEEAEAAAVLDAYREGRFDEAQRRLGSAGGRISPVDRAFLEGLLLASEGRAEAARGAFERALAEPGLDPQDAASIHFEAARACLEAGRWADAAAHARAGGADPSTDAMLRFVEAFGPAPYRVIDGTSGVVPIGTGPLPEVPADVGAGATVGLILDTAATFCVLSRSVARAASVAEIAEGGEALPVFGGTLPVGFGRLGSLSIGAARVEEVPVLVVDDDRLALRYGSVAGGIAVRGILGLDVLRRFAATVDLSRRTLELSPPRTSPAAGAVVARSVGAGLVVSVGVNGSEGMPFLLDTGANRSSLTALGVERLGGRVSIVSAPGGGAALGGRTAFLRKAAGARLQWGRWVVGPFDLPVVGAGNDGDVDRAGVLGLDALAGFRFEIQPEGWRISLEAAAPPDAAEGGAGSAPSHPGLDHRERRPPQEEEREARVR